MYAKTDTMTNKSKGPQTAAVILMQWLIPGLAALLLWWALESMSIQVELWMSLVAVIGLATVISIILKILKR